MIRTNTKAGTSKYFQRIDRFRLAAELLEATLDALRAEGQYRVESLVFWGGSLRDGHATVDHLFVPKGLGVLKHALQVRVNENVVAAICDYLDPPHLVLFGQVHTHIGEAFHSPSDDRFSLDTPGYLSLVIPNAGRDDVSRWEDWAFFECEGGGRFRRIDTGERATRFTVSSNTKVIIQDVYA
jgi:hypothetical protein